MNFLLVNLLLLGSAFATESVMQMGDYELVKKDNPVKIAKAMLRLQRIDVENKIDELADANDLLAIEMNALNLVGRQNTMTQILNTDETTLQTALGIAEFGTPLGVGAIMTALGSPKKLYALALAGGFAIHNCFNLFDNNGKIKSVAYDYYFEERQAAYDRYKEMNSIAREVMQNELTKLLLINIAQISKLESTLSKIDGLLEK